MSRPDLLTRLRRVRHRIRSKLLLKLIDEIIQLEAAAVLSQQAADRWQARAEQAEREREQSIDADDPSAPSGSRSPHAPL